MTSLVYVFSGFTDLWAYTYFHLDFSITRLMMTVVAVFLCAILIPRTLKPSMVLMHMALALIVSPSSVLYACGGYSDFFMIMTLAGYVIILPFQAAGARIPFLEGRLSASNLALICMAFCVSCLGLMLLISGTRYFNVDFRRVYEFRSDARNDLPSVFGYAGSIMGKVLIPLLVTLGLCFRRWQWVAIGFASGFLLFAFTSHKSPLFTPILLIVVYYAARLLVKSPIRAFVYAASVGVVLFGLSWFDFSNGDDGEVTHVGTLFYRRVLMVPSMLNGLYLESFGSLFQFQYFGGNSFTLGLIGAQNTAPSPALIGAYFLGTDSWANTGYIGSGYAQLGVSGVLMYGMLLGIYGSLVDNLSHRHGPVLILTCFFPIFLTIIVSSDLPTAMLSHGGALSLLLVMSLRNGDSCDSVIGVKYQGESCVSHI